MKKGEERLPAYTGDCQRWERAREAGREKSLITGTQTWLDRQNKFSFSTAQQGDYSSQYPIVCFMNNKEIGTQRLHTQNNDSEMGNVDYPD